MTYHINILNNAGDEDDLFGIDVASFFVNDTDPNFNGNAFFTLDPAGLSPLFPQTFAIDFRLFATPVPEPSSAALLALGFAGFATRRRR